VIRKTAKENLKTRILNKLWIIPGGTVWNPYPEIEEYVKKERPDLIYVSIRPAGSIFIAYKIYKKYGIPYVLDYRDPYRCPLIFKKLEKKAVDNAAAVITVTSGFAETLKRWFGRKITVIEHGIANDLISKIKKDRTNRHFPQYLTIGYIGSTSQDYNIDKLITATSKSIYKNKIFVKLVGGVGLNPFSRIYYKKLRKLAQFKKVRCKFLKFKPYFEALTIINSCDITFSGSAYSKPSAIAGKFYDYVGLEKPILLLTKPGTEIERKVRDNRIGLVAYTVDQLKENIEKMRENQKLIKEISENCKILGKKYDWKNRAYELNKLLRQIVDKTKKL